ncbi:MAG TPA: hypothetical protein VIK22_04465 [Candidatus Anoxymicrobiaceae bacterium]
MTATPAAEKGALHSRNGERRFLWHVIAILFIIAVACILFLKNFYTRGILMHVDMTFPTSISRNVSLYAHTWWQYGSVQNIWNTQRVFWSYPLLVVVKLLGLSTSQYLLVLFIGTFALAGISMYALAFEVIGSCKLGVTNRYAPYIGAAFAALIFMYNPFSVSHLWPYFGYPGYAVLPLVFLLLYRAVETHKPKYVVALAVLISVAGVGPIAVAWFWLLILTYLLFHLIVKKFNRESLLVLPKVLLPLGVLYALLNAMWLLPVAGAQLANKPFVPSYSPQLTQTGLDMLSVNNSILNNMRFASGWGMPVNPQVSGTVWQILSFALPVLAVAGLIVLRKKVARDRVMVYWSLMFIISVLLATGTAFILRWPYSFFTLRAPGSASLGWVLRAADRWLCYAPIFYGLILGLLVVWLLGTRKGMEKALAAVLVAVVLVSFVPIALPYAQTVYDPAPVPADYDNVNSYIAQTADEARPIWIPFSRDGFHYYWAPEKRVGAFNVYSSNPNLNNLQDLFSTDPFYYWLESLFWKVSPSPLQVLNRDVMLQKNLASRLFIPFSAQYMICDTSVPGYRFGDTFNEDDSLQLVKKTKILDVFKLTGDASLVRTAVRTVRLNSYYDELAIVQKLSVDDLKRISFIVHERPLDKKDGALNLNDYKDYYDINSSFEETEGGMPVGWAPEQKDVRVSYMVDTLNWVRGKQSLRVENNANEDLAISWVAGPEIPAQAGEIYSVETNIKYTNSKWTHVAVEGYDPSADKWVRLVRCPTAMVGDSGWNKTNISFYMPAGFSKIRPALAAGWREDTNKGPALSWFDNIRIARVDDRFFTDITGGGPLPTVKYQQVSPEKYRVQVRGATGPFVLVFGEAFDPLWEARTSDGHKIEAARQYSAITGFPVDGKGNFDLTIEYAPQRWFVQGLWISLVTLLFCLGFLAIGIISRKRIGKLIG